VFPEGGRHDGRVNQRKQGFQPRHLLWGLCLAVLSAQAYATAANDWSLLRETRLEYPMSAKPYYPFLPVNADGGGRASLGADFSQVYYAASAIRHGDAPYAPRHAEFRDRLGRRPNYPPFTNHVYVPLTFLSYPDALVVHTLAGLVIFLGLTLFVLGRLGLRHHAVGLILATLLLVLQTPIGFSHIERGQFDLFVASSFLLVASSIYVGSAALAFTAVGACFGALKWTAVPVLLAFSLAGLVASTTVRRRLAYWAIPVVLGLSAMVFASELRDYWPSVQHYELQGGAVGMSLEHLLPSAGAKAVPILSVLGFLALFLLRTRRDSDPAIVLQAVAVPFGLAVALQSLCMFRIAYEYRAVALLGFLPVVVIWMERATSVRWGLRMVGGILVGVFFVLAFRVFDLRGTLLSSEQMLYVYGSWSLAFLALAVNILFGPRPTPIGANHFLTAA
jgi:hypothetical protein